MFCYSCQFQLFVLFFIWQLQSFHVFSGFDSVPNIHILPFLFTLRAVFRYNLFPILSWFKVMSSHNFINPHKTWSISFIRSQREGLLAVSGKHESHNPGSDQFFSVCIFPGVQIRRHLFCWSMVAPGSMFWPSICQNLKIFGSVMS